MPGAGTYLHDLVKQRTGESPHMGCKCNSWVKRMDKEGPAWCRKHLREIVAVLAVEARRNAKRWHAIPVDSEGKPLPNTSPRGLRSLLWRGAMAIPGSGLLLEPFITKMVNDAIAAAEADLSSTPGVECQPLVHDGYTHA